MNSSPCQCKEAIRRRAIDAGACACGFVRAEAVDAEARGQYQAWVAEGRNGTMQYCLRHNDLRDDPRLLLEGARTVISCAFSYYNPAYPSELSRRVSRYAWGTDYHYVLRRRLEQLAGYIRESWGGETRVCVDSAPIRERYWARRAGVGYIGRNGQLIVPGAGSYVFIGEVLWTGDVDPDAPLDLSCDGCGACRRACPGGALDGGCSIDARRCVSYLTIEHRGELPPGARLGGWIYGCDRCQQVCPHNRDISARAVPELLDIQPLINLEASDLPEMTPSHFRRLTRHSAMQRITLARLLRNLEG